MRTVRVKIEVQGYCISFIMLVFLCSLSSIPSERLHLAWEKVKLTLCSLIHSRTVGKILYIAHVQWNWRYSQDIFHLFFFNRSWWNAACQFRSTQRITSVTASSQSPWWGPHSSPSTFWASVYPKPCHWTHTGTHAHTHTCAHTHSTF